MFNVICNKKDLLKSINECQKAINSKCTLDILKNFHLKATKDTLEIIGYDLEIGISSSFKTSVVEEGELLINARLFSDIIRKMPESDITLNYSDELLFIICGKSKFKLKCENVKDYPSLPIENTDCSTITLDTNMFKTMVKETVFAISHDITKPILNGVSIDILEENLKFAAIDGYRLAISDCKVEKQEQIKSLIVPGKTLNDVCSILDSNKETFELSFNEKYVIFSFKNTTLVGRLLDGNFIEYSKLVPNEFTTNIKVNTKSLIDSLDRICTIESGKNHLCNLNILNGLLNISSQSDIGSGIEEVPIELTGDTLNIAFNSRYLIEGLRAIKSDEIIMNFTTNVNPCVIKPIYDDEANKDYTYLLLPVRQRQVAPQGN